MGAAAECGNPFTVQGVVTGDFQLGSINCIDGYYVQDAAGDGNVDTSDGIFVYNPAPFLLEVTVGDTVRITWLLRRKVRAL